VSPAQRGKMRLITMNGKWCPVVCLSLIFFVAPLSGQKVNYDGRWLLSVDQRNREGFVHGFLVCYPELVERKVFQESFAAYRTRLLAYLQANPASLSESVGDLLLKMARPPYAKPVHRPAVPNESAEELAEKWGPHNDGDEWRGPGSWHLGYIEGFLDCYSSRTKQEYGTFSKPPQWYVDAIAKWYGTKPGDSDALDLSHARDKIPEVLFRFRDGNDSSK
jgi:hypothetical protein